MTAPLIHLADDTPRARRVDPEASHVAADRSSFSRKKVLIAALVMLREDGEMTGVEANERYRDWRETNPREVPRCAPDTVRKRIGEAVQGYLVDVVSHRHGTLEAVYRIAPEGRALLERLGR